MNTENLATFIPRFADFQHPTQPLQNSPVSSTNFSDVAFPQPPSLAEATKRRGNGKKTGPKGVPWTASKERKLSRLHSLTAANISDIPIILKDGSLQFSKRHAQDRLNNYLGDRPNPLRPINEAQSLARVETSFNLKMHLKTLSQKSVSSSSSNNRATTPALLSPCNSDDSNRTTTSTEFEALFADYCIPTPIPSFKQTFDDFANKEIGIELLSPVSHASKAGHRSSFASLQSLERRIADRVPQEGKQLTPYTSEDLRSFLFVTRKLSVDTITSKYSDFTVSSLNSYAGSRTSVSSTLTIKPNIAQSTNRSSIATITTSSRQYNDSQGGEEVSTRFEKIGGQSEPTTEDAPHHANAPEETQVRITLNQANECCSTLNRGDPRASQCMSCLLFEPKAHCATSEFLQLRANLAAIPKVMRTMTQQTDLAEILSVHESNILGNLHETDMFHDTVLHTAASRGATCNELLWLTAGVNIHARNAADQTFLHVLNTRAWETFEKSDLATNIEEFRSLLLYLLQHSFDFRSADQYGQTPLHLLTRHRIHSTYIKSWFAITQMTTKTKPPNRDFHGRTVDGQLEMQSCSQRAAYEDPYRRSVLTAFILPASLARDSKDSQPTNNTFLASPTNVLHVHNKCRSLIKQALSGFPDAEYQGLSALHCLARSCRTYGLGIISQTLGSLAAPVLPSSENISKRKLAQRGLLTRHDYIIEAVKKLCKANVDVNNYDLNGFTPLMAFVQWELSCTPADRKTVSEVLTILIKNGANVHSRNRRGRTALHIAMRLGRVGAVETLLANHANVHATANNRHSVLDLAGKAMVRAQNDPALCARLTACIGIAVKYGAVVNPDTELEWANQIKCMEKGRSSPQDGVLPAT